MHRAGSQPLRMLGYARVSTDEQAESGLGLDAQEAAVARALEHRGWELAELIVDPGASGKDLKRPGIRRALREIGRGRADGLIVAKLDRLTRSVADFVALLEWFHRADAVLVLLDIDVDTSTPQGRMVATLMASVAELERGLISERTKAALGQLRAKGKPTGRPSVADQPKLTQRIQQMRDSGMSLQKIADQLNREGVPTLRGAEQWRKSAVQAAAGYTRPPRQRKPTSLPPITRAARSRSTS